MRNIFEGILKFVNIIDNLVQKLITLLFSVMMVTLLAQVILRYIFNFSFSWSAELSRYLLIWIIFLAGGKGLITGAHMSIDLLTKRLSDRLERVIINLSYFIVLFFLFFLTRQGFIVLTRVSRQASPALRIPMSIPYAAVPVGSIIMVLYMIKIIIESNIFGKEEGC